MLGRAARIAGLGLVAAGLMVLTGCGPFFITPTNSGGGTGGGANGNVTYVINTVTNTVSGFTVGTGTLTNAPSMPFQLGYTPQAEVVTIPNTVLYVAGPGAIYAYFINSDGSLSVPAAGAAQVIIFVLSMDVTPDGNWLIALDGTTTQLDIYQINKSTGGLASDEHRAVRDSERAGAAEDGEGRAQCGSLIFASLGTGGDLVFTFNTANGSGGPEPDAGADFDADQREWVGDRQHFDASLYRAERVERGAGGVHDRDERGTDFGDGVAVRCGCAAAVGDARSYEHLCLCCERDGCDDLGIHGWQWGWRAVGRVSLCKRSFGAGDDAG